MNTKHRRRKFNSVETKRDIWQEVLEGAREIKAGGGKRTAVAAYSSVAVARTKAGLTKSQFAELLGVTERTLERWEQGRAEPSGAAKSLIRLAGLHPEAVREIAA